MKEKGITLSEKHGVNPSITHCECCGKETGIALFGRLKGDQEAPRDVYAGLCEDCEKVIKLGGVLVIEVKDGEKGPDPYRTGRIVGCSKNFKEKFEIESNIVYMEESMFSQLFSEHLKEKQDGEQSA
jgi:hypothetical protein